MQTSIFRKQIKSTILILEDNAVNIYNLQMYVIITEMHGKNVHTTYTLINERYK